MVVSVASSIRDGGRCAADVASNQSTIARFPAISKGKKRRGRGTEKGARGNPARVLEKGTFVARNRGLSSFTLTPRSRVGGIVEVIEGIICWEIEGEEEEGRRALGRIWKDPCERVTPRFVYTSCGGRVLTGRAREFHGRSLKRISARGDNCTRNSSVDYQRDPRAKDN